MQKYEIQTQFIYGWENVWKDENDNLVIFNSYAEAKEELANHLAEGYKALKEGDLSEFSENDYRINPVNSQTKRKIMEYYDNYEVHPVKEDVDGIGNKFCEQVNNDKDASFFTLYGHLNTGGVEAIGDFNTREAAEDVARKMLHLARLVKQWSEGDDENPEQVMDNIVSHAEGFDYA